jgi:hypothetical protein
LLGNGTREPEDHLQHLGLKVRPSNSSGLPVRRDVLSRPHISLPRSKTSPKARAFFFSVWHRVQENVFADDVTNALATIVPNDPPRFLAARTVIMTRPDPQRSGGAVFSRVAVETRAEQSRASSPRPPAVAYCQGTPLLSVIIRDHRRGKAPICSSRLRRSPIADIHGRGAAKIQAHIIVAVN